MYKKCWRCGEELEITTPSQQIYSEAYSLQLEEPIDRIEFIAYRMLQAYKKEARTWYDLARVAAMSAEAYDKRYEGI